ncbi:MAG: 50S ribosomal protein L25 [Verrucomicrobiales bacterium]|nr:50S ribosomal protein L25 [Verrucomicrobiales bacterium]
MASILDLNAETRQRSGSASVRRLRKEGLVPAVIYGKKTENANIKVDAKAISMMLRDSASDNLLVNLKLDNGAGEQLALIQNVQHDHLNGGILHIDFHAVNMNESIHAQVPIEVHGEAVGVKAGGQLDILLHTIEVFCKPKDLPAKLDIDVSGVEVGQAIHVRDIPLPSGVEIHLDGEVVVLAVSEPRVAADATDAPAAAAAAPAAS